MNINSAFSMPMAQSLLHGTKRLNPHSAELCPAVQAGHNLSAGPLAAPGVERVNCAGSWETGSALTCLSLALAVLGSSHSKHTPETRAGFAAGANQSRAWIFNYLCNHWSPEVRTPQLDRMNPLEGSCELKAHLHSICEITKCCSPSWLEPLFKFTWITE